MYREFPPVAFLAAASLLLPLPWHWRARNVATLSIIAWLFVLNIIYGVDAIVWGDNVNIVIPVWCDITGNIIIGANTALPAACLCVCIHLERVASVRQAQTTYSDKRRRQVFEGLMCFALPMLFMGLHYIVQGHRFDIIEEYGCRPTTYVSIPALFLVFIPPLVLSTLALGFAAVAFVHFMRRRITFARHLENSRNGFTTSRYFRLMVMAVVEMIWNILVSSYALWFSMLSYRPWTNWDDVHSNFSRIDLYPSAFTPTLVVQSYYLIWWIVPASTFIFVGFFAFGRDAVEEYKACFKWLRRTFLRQRVEETTVGSFGSIPVAKYPIPAMIRPPSMYKSSSTSKELGDYYPSSPVESDIDGRDRISISLAAPPYRARAVGFMENLRMSPTHSQLSCQSHFLDVTSEEGHNHDQPPHQIV